LGFGDELMATAQARMMQLRDPRKVAVRGKDGRARLHPIWDSNPRIAKPAEVSAGADVQWLDNRPGARPYLDYRKFTPTRWFYTAFSVNDDGPGELYLSPGELAVAKQVAGAIIIEPSVKPGRATMNKDWGYEKWKQLSRLIINLPLVQLGPGGTRVLRNVKHVITRTPREACGALTGARAIVTTEGGLHHAAAALGIPAVVIFGGYNSPATTGYNSHVNIHHPDPEYPLGCGTRIPCAHCRDAMSRIMANEVAAALLKLLKEGGNRVA
jgi:hypothetical protein